MKDDDFEPLDGVFAVPAPKNVPRYNFARLDEYCKQINKRPRDLTDEEKKMFIINKDK